MQPIAPSGPEAKGRDPVVHVGAVGEHLAAEPIDARESRPVRVRLLDRPLKARQEHAHHEAAPLHVVQVHGDAHLGAQAFHFVEEPRDERDGGAHPRRRHLRQIVAQRGRHRPRLVIERGDVVALPPPLGELWLDAPAPRHLGVAHRPRAPRPLAHPVALVGMQH